MFSHTSDTLITGGTFTVNHRNETHIHGTKPRGIELLLEASAPGAFHNSGERFDPPKCHPHTRTAVLEDIVQWVIGQVGWDGMIMWLYGPAGAGKSAISQTIAERFYAEKRLLASFFFSRSDRNRSHAGPLIATLAYQIALNLPQSRAFIEAAVENDPAIFRRSLAAQFTSLIVEPFLSLSDAGFIAEKAYPRLVIIDGLDECRDPQVQRSIIDILFSCGQDHRLPLIFLVACRPTPELSFAFSASGLATATKRLALDDSYFPNDDIKRYLKISFAQISKNHPLRMFIPSSWPNNDILHTLVEKSSGQFIFAATVVKFVSSVRHQPVERLDIVLGISPPRNDRPFAELDALYTNVLSSIEDLESSLGILDVLVIPQNEEELLGWDLGFELYLQPAVFSYRPVGRSPDFLEKFLFLNPGEVQRLLLDLGSVIEYKDQKTQVRMLHASLGDFLLDQTRSMGFHVDPVSVHKKLAHLCFRHINDHATADHADTPDPVKYAYVNVVIHCLMAGPTDQLDEDIRNTPLITSLCERYLRLGLQVIPKFLNFLKTSGFSYHQELYIFHRDIWDRILRVRLEECRSELLLTTCIVLTDPAFDDSVEHIIHDMFPEEISIDAAHLHVLGYPLLFRTFARKRNIAGYLSILLEFLTDPIRAGRFVLEGKKYARVASLTLKYISALRLFDNISHSPKTLETTSHILILLKTLLLKASYSEDLVRRLNQISLSTINRRMPQHVKPVEIEIGEYLSRTGENS